MSNIDEQSDLSESYVAPPRTFRGVELKPYTDGYKMLLAMITREGDPTAFFLFSALYVLTHDRMTVQKAAANKDRVREDIMQWLDDLKMEHATEIPFKGDGSPNPAYVPKEFEKTQDMILEILQEANKNKVDPIATAAGGNG